MPIRRRRIRPIIVRLGRRAGPIGRRAIGFGMAGSVVLVGFASASMVTAELEPTDIERSLQQGESAVVDLAAVAAAPASPGLGRADDRTGRRRPRPSRRPSRSTRPRSVDDDRGRSRRPRSVETTEAGRDDRAWSTTTEPAVDDRRRRRPTRRWMHRGAADAAAVGTPRHRRSSTARREQSTRRRPRPLTRRRPSVRRPRSVRRRRSDRPTTERPTDDDHDDRRRPRRRRRPPRWRRRRRSHRRPVPPTTRRRRRCQHRRPRRGLRSSSPSATR